MKSLAPFLVALTLMFSALGAQQWESDHPTLSGRYEVIGRHFESGTLFDGIITIKEIAPNKFSVTRIVGGNTVIGTGKVELATPDKIPVLRIAFQDKGQHMEGTFLYRPDLDNEARISGYVYPKGYTGRNPGKEALFAIKEIEQRK